MPGTSPGTMTISFVPVIRRLPPAQRETRNMFNLVGWQLSVKELRQREVQNAQPKAQHLHAMSPVGSG